MKEDFLKPIKKKRIFTHREAEALLPELEKRLRQLRSKKETYSRMHDTLFVHELVCAAEKAEGFFEDQDGLEDGIHALEEAIEDLAKDVEAIVSLGCFLRNIDHGHIEFFGSHDGEKVYFSWRLGEPGIHHYRSLQSHPTHRVAISKSSEKNHKK